VSPACGPGSFLLPHNQLKLGADSSQVPDAVVRLRVPAYGQRLRYE
jgi:hypothetical protein